MVRRTLFVVLVVGLTLSASGSSAFGGSDKDQDIADASILTEDDVVEFGLDETSPASQPPPKVPACKKIRALLKAAERQPNAESEFDDGVGTFANNRVFVYPSESRASALIRAYAGRTGPECNGAAIRTSAEDVFGPDANPELSGGLGDAGVGDENIYYQVALTVTGTEGDEVTLYLELGFIRVGRALAVVEFQAEGAPFEGSDDLLDIVVDNLAANIEG